MEKQNKPLSEKEIIHTETDSIASFRRFESDDVKQAVKEAYEEIVSMSGIYAAPVKRIFKDKFGFEL